MIVLTRRLRALLRRAALGLGPRGPAPPLVFLADPDSGLRARVRLPHLALECLMPGACRPAESIALPLDALAELEGRDDSPVVLEAAGPGRTLARWEDRGIPQHRDHDVAEGAALLGWPAEPARWAAAPAGLLEALAEAAAVAAEDAGSRYDLACLRLHGDDGEVAATDGRQLLVRRGLPLPWAGDRLVRRTPLLARLAALADGPAAVGAADGHVALRVGPWTAWLTVQSGRFPRLDGVLPPASAAATTLRLDPSDARLLADALPRLPGADELHAPVTLDCNGRVVVRARAGDGRVTELVLARSRHHGPDVRLATDRGPLARALRLGLAALEIAGPGLPLACRSGDRIFGWQPLAPESALGPADDAVRIDSADVDVRPPTHAGPAPTPTSTPRTSMSEPRHEPTPAAAADPPAGLAELIAEAAELHEALGQARARAARLVAGLRRHRRRQRQMESTLAALRQLRLADAV